MNIDMLKFRFWDPEYNCYADTDFVSEYIVDDCGIDIGIEVINGAIPEQCTGLKDKNGNLIYIGDIVKCGEWTIAVKYANGEDLIDGIYPFNLYHDCEDECHCQLRDFPEYACEIIGNIHETKGDIKNE